MNVTLDIDSLASGGQGVARLEDGRAAFVHGAVPGDRVSAVITQDKKRHVNADILEILEPSPLRVAAPCPYFALCGGCQWQHIAYRAQLEAKRQIVVDALAHIGRVTHAADIVEQMTPSGTPYGYRNKIELVARTLPDGFTLGFTQAHHDTIVPIEACLLLPKRAQRAPKALRGALRYLSGNQDLGISRVGIRVAANTRDVEVALWTKPSGFPRNLAAATIAQAAKATGVTRVIVKDSDHPRSVSKVEILKGKGAWKERLLGHSMLVSAPSFFQVNTPAAEKLIEIVMEALDPGPSDTVVDLYAGVGTFTIPIAEHADTIAIEASRHALADLTRNAENASVYIDARGGDAERQVNEIAAADRILVDPPRVGLTAPAVAAISSLSASRIVYVSCDPATLARDIERFASHGYTLTRAAPVDMFPQTYHVETVAVLDASNV